MTEVRVSEALTAIEKIAANPLTAPLPKKDSKLQAEAEALLKNPSIFEFITVNEFDKKIVGEIESRQTIFLCAMGGMLVEEPSLAAYNLMINSQSGAGKDHVVKNVVKLLPEDRRQIRTRISPTAFTYWHNAKYEPDWTWNGKVCYLSDISNNILNHEVFKVMCTEGSTATITINNRAVDIEINGKPALFITTAGAMPNDEMLRRFPIVELDESIDQTTAIMEREAEYAAKGISTDFSSVAKYALSILRRVRVKVPFAPELVKAFPPKHLIMRTHFGRLLSYIKASAALHQHQREQDAEGYILASSEDYNIARIALKKTTSNPLMVPLTKYDKRILEVCRKEKDWFAVSDILHRINFMSEKSLYVHLSKLSDVGLFEVDKEMREHSYKPVTIYKSKEFTVSIPTWEEICRISTITSPATITSLTTITSNTGVIEAFEAFEVNIAPTDSAILKEALAFLRTKNKGEGLSIGYWQKKFPVITDDVLQRLLSVGEVLENPSGWVRVV